MIRQRVDELALMVKEAENLYQVGRVSGIGVSTLRNIRRSGVIGAVTTAVILEETFRLLALNPDRNKAPGRRPKGDM